MSFKIKTLIVCDTNSLRNTEAGEIAYSSFSFGKTYSVIEEFIKENNLEDHISLAVPKMVIEELKVQKQRSYDKDIQDLKKIFLRLNGLPHIPNGDLKIPDENFKCADYIEDEANKYIAENKVNLLEIQDDDAASILKNMLVKVVGRDKPKPPFAISGKYYKDAGFKDNVIWETLMHFQKVTDFDKVIFFTKDGDYGDCYLEFQARWQRYCKILTSEDLVIAELRADYDNYIENRKVYEYANKDYFKDYLDDLLKEATFIDYEGESCAIENYKVVNYCQSVNQVPDEEGDFVSVEFFSEVLIYITYNAAKIEVPISAKTVLSDLDYMEIEETVFDPNIN